MNILDLIYRCKNLRSFKKIHAQLITSSLILDKNVITKVAEFFGKSVTFADYACDFFIQDGFRSNSYSFNTLIAGYATSNKPQAAFFTYKRLIRCGFWPDMFSFPVVLKSCSKFLGAGEGKQIHGVVVKMGFGCDLYVQNSLLHFYCVCGECVDATTVFDEMPQRDVVSYTGLISGYVRTGLFDEAVILFLKMDVKPNIAAFVSVLVACGRLWHVNMGKGIHGLILKHAFEKDLVISNALLDMYVKCEYLCEAKQLFKELPERDVVSWTSMINGLVQCKFPEESLELFNAMLMSGVEPDKVILTSILSACASIGAFDYGRWIHEYIDCKGIEWDVHIGTAMIDMYSKCGCIDMALQTFNKLSIRNVFTWNALLGGLAIHGNGHEALKHFELMVRAGFRPNEVTFLAILTACCHSGMADEGRRHFYQMQSYNISPRLEHYGCMVDLLCKAGLFDEAQDIIRSMPMAPDALIWGALLSACNAKGNVELSQDLVDRICLSESKDSGVYVLLSNMLAIHGRWDDVTWARRSMKEKGLEKSPGSSVIEVSSTAHEFLAGNRSHSQTGGYSHAVQHSCKSSPF